MNGRTGLRLATSAAAGVATAVAVRAARGALTATRRAAGPAQADGRRTYLRAVTIYRPIDEVYAFWRDLQPLARVLPRVLLVEELDERRSRWVVAGPADTELAFHAEVVTDDPPRLVAWRATDSPVPHEGRVELRAAPGDRGTEVRVRLTYRPPAGDIGVALARLTGDEPDQLLRDALRRIKQVLEAGEVVVVDAPPSGRGSLQERVTGIVVHRAGTGGRA
jgi:uncharacterized membrane protein